MFRDNSGLVYSIWIFESPQSLLAYQVPLSNVQGVVIVYDITNPDTFSHLSKWVHDIATVSCVVYFSQTATFNEACIC